MSSYLPEEVVVNILSHLPPKSLLRFRCVSKTWFALIGTLDFVSENLINNSILNPKSQHPYPPFLLVKSREKCNHGKLKFDLLSFDNLDCVRLNLPQLLPPFVGLGIVSSCNGILCLYDHYLSDIYLWNPTSSLELKVLPPFSHPDMIDGIVYGVGFGFDSISDNFKVVIFLGFLMADTDFVDVKVEVYSLGSGSLKRLDTDPNMLNGVDSYLWKTVYDNGVFYWWVDDYYDERIVSFDFSDEVFRMTPLPDKSAIGNCYEGCRSLMVLNGFVAMAVKKEVSFSIWVLLEFGVKESWTKLFRIGHYFDLERPLCFWKNGELFMEDREGQLVLYDPFTQTAKNLQLNGFDGSLAIVPYMQSSGTIDKYIELI